MKKFELPEFVEEEKIPEIFNDKAKNSLSIFTAKKEHVEVRERAHTFYDKPRSTLILFIFQNLRKMTIWDIIITKNQKKPNIKFQIKMKNIYLKSCHD